ncbi:MAG: GNAT family N-acetyltransferase [Pseudomonadota bacterium]
MAETADDIRAVRFLIEAYATWLADDHGISLEFQGIESELASLPGSYAPPGGALLLAGPAEAPLGCAAFRAHEPGVCEIKRLYVMPAAQGMGLGRRLAEAILEKARQTGYTRALLDTAPFMGSAIALYRSFGFVEIDPYCHNPIPGCLFLACDLADL